MLLVPALLKPSDLKLLKTLSKLLSNKLQKLSAKKQLKKFLNRGQSRPEKALSLKFLQNRALNMFSRRGLNPLSKLLSEKLRLTALIWSLTGRLAGLLTALPELSVKDASRISLKIPSTGWPAALSLRLSSAAASDSPLKAALKLEI